MKLYMRKNRLDHQGLAFGKSRGEEREKRLENVIMPGLDVIACLTRRSICASRFIYVSRMCLY